MLNTIDKMYRKLISFPIVRILFPMVAVYLTFFLVKSALGINCNGILCDPSLGGFVSGFPGSVQPGATVTVTNPENGRSVETLANPDGSFFTGVGELEVMDSTWLKVTDGTDTCDIHCEYPQCVNPDVDKPHSACPDAECWGDCIDPGYENTCTQAAAANVIHAECWECCDFTPEEIYQGIVDMTGNVGQFPEEEKESMLAWVAANCPDCQLEINIAHRGYVGQAPVNPGNVTFDWADQEIQRGEHIKIWVVSSFKLPFPPPPTSRDTLTHELTYKGRKGDQAHIHDSDCDQNWEDCNFYPIETDYIGEYLRDYFDLGRHGYLWGVISVSGRCPAKVEAAPKTAPVGTPATITLTNTGDVPIHVTNLNVHRPGCQHDNIQVDVVLQPGQAESWEYPDAWQPQNPNANVDEVGEYKVSVTTDQGVIETTFERYATAIPTLTEWGLIIFGVVLIGFITWAFLRRRKAIVGVQ